MVASRLSFSEIVATASKITVRCCFQADCERMYVADIDIDSDIVTLYKVNPFLEARVMDQIYASQVAYPGQTS